MKLVDSLIMIRKGVGGTYNLAKVCWNALTPILKKKIKEATGAKSPTDFEQDFKSE